MIRLSVARGKVAKLFATPVVTDEVPNSAALNEMLEKSILAKRAEHAGHKLSNRGGWQSSHDLPEWGGEAAKTVIRHALDLATAYAVDQTRSAPPRWLYDAWANISAAGHFNMPHVHSASFWSAVYYVRLGGGKGGELVLYDPRMPGLRMHAPDVRFRDMGPEVRAPIEPKEGMMVLFPAWLSHSVEPCEGTGNRISIAINIRAALDAPRKSSDGVEP